ncbi:hypothetical protein ACH5RR_012637 [Cinchona calisaya]|uniref:RING-type E3 ubiquitin transferase n=1 Tax=Cinchona calisaya TaxID=153742 RepID=A0ABD3AAP6_9GENT
MAAASTSGSSTVLIQELFVQFHSRKLLLHTPLLQPPVSATPPTTGNISHDPSGPSDNSFDANVVMVLSVLLCALICSLGLNSIIRCALRCSSLVSSESDESSSARLANTGIKKKDLKTFPTINYTTELKLPGFDTECAICLSEFTTGERVRVLPNCHHGFHVRCIDKWLNSHSSCPTCRHCLIETYQKIIGCSQQASTSVPEPIPAPRQETIVRIAPLGPEGLLHNYHT